jgi:uncharacterized phage protein gp47/JayE
MTSPTAPTINANGITVPQFADILAYLQTQFQAIYGADVYLGNDSQDGQFLGVIAAAINDSNAAAVAVYNSMSPATAQGNGLSNNVKINGLSRLVASNSTVDVTLTGVAGTIITNGIVADANQNNWNLPASVTIPNAGTITVTATAAKAGAIAAPAGTVTSIKTPTLGWQTVTNASDAALGNPVETDAQLRVRQAASVALPSKTVLQGIVGAVEAITGVTLAKAYENDTNTTDSNGLPAHSIALVVQGGDSTAIATAILEKKTPGAYTQGTTSQTITDGSGFTNTIRFYRPTLKALSVEVKIKALTNYTTVIGDEIKASMMAYIAGLGVGDDVLIPRLYVPAQLGGAPDSLTYEITWVKASIKPNAVGTTDLTIAFNELATLALADINLVVV